MANTESGGTPQGAAPAADDPIARFVASSERLLQWVNNKALDPDDEARVAYMLLLEINYQLLLLPALQPTKQVQGTRPDDSYQAFFEYRFQQFPLRFYAFSANPFANPPEPSVIGDVAEDITIIYLDLYEGLSLYHGKHVPEAVWFWRESFVQGWGKNLVNAVGALYNFIALPN